MCSSDLLLTLADWMAGEFDNREQAIAEPIWFVHLRFWQRRVPLFAEDSVTLFAEQANVLKPDQPYRQRLLRLQATSNHNHPIQVQYYAFKDPVSVQGAGQDSAKLQNLPLAEIERLPGCILEVTQTTAADGRPKFLAVPPPDAKCYFTYQDKIRQVSLGFEASPDEFLSYDKGIEPETGKALWGALMGAYRFQKRHKL